MTQRVLGWVLTLAAVAGIAGTGLWADQAEAAVAAALLVGAVGLFPACTHFDGFVDVVAALSRVATGLRRARRAARYRPGVRTVRTVTFVVLVVLSVVGLQVAPVVLLDSDGVVSAAGGE